MDNKNNPIINCELCGGRYRKYFKKKHYETKLHKDAENKQYLNLNDETSRQLYNKNIQIEKLKDIIFQHRILTNILKS